MHLKNSKLLQYLLLFPLLLELPEQRERERGGDEHHLQTREEPKTGITIWVKRHSFTSRDFRDSMVAQLLDVSWLMVELSLSGYNQYMVVLLTHWRN